MTYTYRNREFNSKASLCKYYNVKINTFYHQLRRGKSIEEAMDLLINGGQYKYHNNYYKSLTELCNSLDIKYITMKSYCLRNGIELSISNIENCIDAYLDFLGKRKITYRGVEYNSRTALLKAYDKLYLLSTKRYIEEKSDKVLFELLEESLKYTENIRDRKEKEFKGVTYSSFDAMCKAYNKNSKTIKNRLNHGLTLEEAMNLDGRFQCKNVKTYYVFGEYFNKDEISKIFNINRTGLNNKNTSEELEAYIKYILLKKGIILNEIGNLLVCSCQKCNNQVYVEKSEFSRWIQHHDRDYCIKHRLDNI